MRHRRGFYGLLAEGWDFTDFGAPWPRGRIPADADPSELIVGLLDSERLGGGGAGGNPMSAAELNTAAARFYEQRSCTPVPFAQVVRLSDASLARIRQRLRELVAQWNLLPLGESMELTFDLKSTSSP